MNRMAIPRPNIAALTHGASSTAMGAIHMDLMTTEADVEEAIARWPLQPVGERLHVLKLIVDKTEGGLYIPQEKAELNSFNGVVIAAGPLAWIDSPYEETPGAQTRVSLDLFGRHAVDLPGEETDSPNPLFRWSYRLKPGDRVRFASWSGVTEVDTATGRRAMLMNADDVTAEPRRKE